MSNSELRNPALCAAGIGVTKAWLLLALMAQFGCAIAPPRAPQLIASDTHQKWTDESLALIQKYQLNPLRAARVLAHVHLGMTYVHDEVLLKPSMGACLDVAMSGSSSVVLNYFFPYETPGRLLAKPELLTPADRTCADARAIGAKIGEERIYAAMRDGAIPPRRLRNNPNRQLGTWQATEPLFITIPLEPYAGEWATFFLTASDIVVIKPPPEATAPEYGTALLEVIAAQRALTPSQRESANAWHLEAGSVTPPGVWNLKLRDLLQDSRLTPAARARLYAALNMAMYDALVVCWRAKYQYWTERPITAAKRHAGSAFSPLLVTPAFPSYPSGHACTSGAAAEVIAAYLPATSSRVATLAVEAADSRLFGGIHFRFDNDEGLRLGRLVGVTAVARMPPN